MTFETKVFKELKSAGIIFDVESEITQFEHMSQVLKTTGVQAMNTYLNNKLSSNALVNFEDRELLKYVLPENEWLTEFKYQMVPSLQRKDVVW